MAQRDASRSSRRCWSVVVEAGVRSGADKSPISCCVHVKGKWASYPFLSKGWVFNRRVGEPSRVLFKGTVSESSSVMFERMVGESSRIMLEGRVGWSSRIMLDGGGGGWVSH